MSRYKIGDVVQAPYAYFDTNKGYIVSQLRLWVVVKVEGDEEDENITVSCTKRLYQADRHVGVIVRCNSPEGIEMSLDIDTFIYCDETVVFMDSDIKRKVGKCPLIEEILQKLGFRI